MSARAWRRLRRERGLWPLALLLALLCLTALAVYELLGAHLRLQDDREAKEAGIMRAQARLEQLPRLEKALDSERTALGAIAARLVPSDEGAPAATGERFAALLREWYAAQGVKQAVVLGLTRREEDGVVYVRAEVQAPMGIEQLAALLQGKSSAPLALRLVEANVEGNDANAPTGLRTRMSWEALVATPKAAPKEQASDKKKADKPGQRSVERGGALPLGKEEKRK